MVRPNGKIDLHRPHRHSHRDHHQITERLMIGRPHGRLGRSTDATPAGNPSGPVLWSANPPACKGRLSCMNITMANRAVRRLWSHSLRGRCATALHALGLSNNFVLCCHCFWLRCYVRICCAYSAACYAIALPSQTCCVSIGNAAFAQYTHFTRFPTFSHVADISTVSSHPSVLTRLTPNIRATIVAVPPIPVPSSFEFPFLPARQCVAIS